MKNYSNYSKAAFATLASAAFVGLICIMPASAATQLAVNCSTETNNNNTLWKTSANGGVAPYAFAWSGDSKVAGATTTQVAATYLSNGTYIGTVQVTDASSTVATTSCQAVVSYFATSTPTPTSTPPSHIKVDAESSLEVGAKGSFEARNLIVQSVGASTLSASVWGITYTINIASGTPFSPKRFAFSDVRVGDQLEVVGKVSSTSPLTVTAKSVHDLSLVASTTRNGKPWKYRHESTGYSKRADKGDDNRADNRGWGGKVPFLNWLWR